MAFPASSELIDLTFSLNSCFTISRAALYCFCHDGNSPNKGDDTTGTCFSASEIAYLSLLPPTHDINNNDGNNTTAKRIFFICIN